MIILAWRWFHRFVIGTAYLERKIKCQRYIAGQYPCGDAISPLCVNHHCSTHCRAQCDCSSPKRLSADEVALVSEYRKAIGRPQLEAVK